jgi:hypothetical protein
LALVYGGALADESRSRRRNQAGDSKHREINQAGENKRRRINQAVSTTHLSHNSRKVQGSHEIGHCTSLLLHHSIDMRHITRLGTVLHFFFTTSLI